MRVRVHRCIDEGLDAPRDCDLLGHLVAEREVTQRARHLRLHEARVEMVLRGSDEHLWVGRWGQVTRDSKARLDPVASYGNV